MCKPGDSNTALPKPPRNIMRCRLTLHVRVSGNNQLCNIAVLDARLKLCQMEALRASSLKRGKRPAQHMVHAAKLTAALDGKNIHGILDNTDNGGVATGIATNRANPTFSDKKTGWADSDNFLDSKECVGKSCDLLSRSTQAVKCQALGSLGTNAREFAKRCP